MKTTLLPFLLAVVTGLVMATPLTLPAEEKEAPKRHDRGKGERAKSESWESLTPKQREQLREALRGVWTDPVVLNAREEVKRASDAYQTAIKSAVERVDPSVAALLAKVQGVPRVGTGRGGPLSGLGAPGQTAMRGFDEQIRPPGFLDGLEPEMRETFRKAEAEAAKSEAVKKAKEELAKVRKEDDAIRRKRLEAHRALRKVMLEEMIKIDPSIASFQKRLSEGERAGEASPEKMQEPGEGEKLPPPNGQPEPRENKAEKAPSE